VAQRHKIAPAIFIIVETGQAIRCRAARHAVQRQEDRGGEVWTYTHRRAIEAPTQSVYDASIRKKSTRIGVKAL
jgi:hypothetical protein